MRSQPAVQLLREGTKPSTQPRPACEALCRHQHGPGRAQDELQPVLNSQQAPKEPASSIMGSQDWKKSYKKRLSGPWHKPFIPQSLQSRALAAKSAGHDAPSTVPGQHPLQRGPSGGMPYLPHDLCALHLQRPAIKEQKIARSIW